MKWNRVFSGAVPMALVMSSVASGQMLAMNEYELQQTTAQIEFSGIPILEEAGFNVSDAGVEVDLDIQADIDSIAYIDDDGIGPNGQAGSIILKGVHIGSSSTPITADQVRSHTPFQADDLAQIHGLFIQADPGVGTLITIDRLGDEHGNGIDIIVNDIFFGKELEDGAGWGLLLEDVSNFVSDDYLTEVNSLFNLNLASVDDGFNTQNGNFYPWKIRMTPLEGSNINSSAFTDLSGNTGGGLEDIVAIPGLAGGDVSMRMDIQFVLRMEKLALYKGNFEMGIQGLMVYQGIDTTGDGIEDTVGPATLNNFLMETVEHTLVDGQSVQALKMNIDFKADIAINNFYIGNPESGSIGAFHINDLDIHNTQLLIYAH